MAGGIFVDDAFEKRLQFKTTELFPFEPPLNPDEVDEIFSSKLSHEQRASLGLRSTIDVTLPCRFDGATHSQNRPGNALFATLTLTE